MLTLQLQKEIIPGRILVNLLAKENISQKELALKTGLTEKHISNIVQGKASITEDTAIKFEYAFGGKASFWINLQKSFDETLARLSFEKQLAAEVELIKNFPFKELANHHFISQATKPLDKIKELLKFFGVPSLKQVKHIQAVAYHQTAVKGRAVDQNAVAAWLRIGDIKYKELLEKKAVPEYRAEEFKKLIPTIRELTRNKDFFNKLPDRLLQKGVILLSSPYLPKTYTSGAVRWIGGHPVIQINDHLKNKDGLFFTIFHEFAHVLLHDKRGDYIDYDGLKSGSKQEAEADKWASETLIKELDYEKFINQNDFSIGSISRFANQIKINQDIVIGRLAHDGKISWQNRSRLVARVVYKNS